MERLLSENEIKNNHASLTKNPNSKNDFTNEFKYKSATPITKLNHREKSNISNYN